MGPPNHEGIDRFAWLHRGRTFTPRACAGSVVAKLPARQKVTVLCFRRAQPDEVLVVAREAKGRPQWGLPSAESDAGESARAAALRLAADFLRGPVVADLDLAIKAEYRVAAGPRAGEWTERFFAVEAAPDCPAPDGQWLPHYEAKAASGADTPRVREAFTRLRELARLRP